MNFIQRLRIAWWFLTKQKGMLVLTCPVCHGTEFDTIDSVGSEETNNYVSTCICKKCHARVTSMEQWEVSECQKK